MMIKMFKEIIFEHKISWCNCEPSDCANLAVTFSTVISQNITEWNIYRRVFILSEDLANTDQSKTSIMKLAYAKNNIIADKKRRNFFKNFYIVLPRSTHQEVSIELSFVLFSSVGASGKNLHSEKKTRQYKWSWS